MPWPDEVIGTLDEVFLEVSVTLRAAVLGIGRMVVATLAFVVLLGGVGRYAANLLRLGTNLEGLGVMDRDPSDVPRVESDDLSSLSLVEVISESYSSSSSLSLSSILVMVLPGDRRAVVHEKGWPSGGEEKNG